MVFDSLSYSLCFTNTVILTIFFWTFSLLGYSVFLVFLVRSSHRKFSVREGVLRNFDKFIGKRLCQNLFLKETLALVLSCEFCEISKNTFLTKHLRATASVSYFASKQKPNFLPVNGICVVTISGNNTFQFFLIDLMIQPNLQHECQIRATRVRHERHECNTSAILATLVRHKQTSATQVRHECYANDTSAERVLHERHECDTSENF